jgi:hypothetical protein
MNDKVKLGHDLRPILEAIMAYETARKAYD